MQGMPFQRPKFQNISGGNTPGRPSNCVVTMASPSLKSWLRHWIEQRLLTTPPPPPTTPLQGCVLKSRFHLACWFCVVKSFEVEMTFCDISQRIMNKNWNVRLDIKQTPQGVLLFFVTSHFFLTNNSALQPRWLTTKRRRNNLNLARAVHWRAMIIASILTVWRNSTLTVLSPEWKAETTSLHLTVCVLSVFH